MSRKLSEIKLQPYSNMPARRVVFYVGFAFTLVGFLLVILSYLFAFMPDIPIPGKEPINTLYAVLVISIVCIAIGTILAVAGANVNKKLARFSFFLSAIGFGFGFGFMVVTFFIKTILPLGALDRLVAKSVLLLQ